MMKMKQSGNDALAMLALIEDAPRTGAQLKVLLSLDTVIYKRVLGRIRHLLDVEHTVGGGNALLFSRNSKPFYLAVCRLPILGERLENKSDMNARRLADYVYANEGVSFQAAREALELTFTQMNDAKNISSSQIKTVRGLGRQVFLYMKNTIVPMPWRKPVTVSTAIRIAKTRIAASPSDANFMPYVGRKAAGVTLFKTNWIPVVSHGGVPV